MAFVRSDQELLDLWHGGDLTAGEELFDRYYDLVYRFFAREVTSDLTPLVQETFDALVLWRAHRQGTSFRATLLANAYRTLPFHRQDETRDHGAIRGDESTETDLRQAPGQVQSSSVDMLEGSTEADADSTPEQREEQRRRRVLRALPLDARVLIELHDVESLSLQEIAVVLDVPVSALYSRLRDVRVQLDRAS